MQEKKPSSIVPKPDMSVELCIPKNSAAGSSTDSCSTEKNALVDIFVQVSAEGSHIDIIDIREGQQSLDLAPAIRFSLQHCNMHGYWTLPSMLLWNEKGLRLFEEVTYTPEYYLTNTEISLLETHSGELARQIEPGTILLELGSGCLRKTGILLQAIEALGKEVDYYALDLDRNELLRTVGQLVDTSRFRHVRCHGLHGTYDDGRSWIARPENAGKPICVISLGSTVGSFAPAEVAVFLKTWAETVKTTSDGGGNPVAASFRILLGLDGCKDGGRVFEAYNDPRGVNKRFILNALDNANSYLRHEAFDARDWTVRGVWDAIAKRHVQYLVPLVDVDVTVLQDDKQQQQQQPETVTVRAGEKVQLVSSYKFDDEVKHRLWEESGLTVVNQCMNHDGSYGEFFMIFLLNY
ncbi:hypothetical protein PGQ11_013325 [Apiospora arundinis]|uniref:Histidine-specific methyltransferase SAM-dependent domain-containing protein n=1 Tax=Apiospora arundinis TaxID=335852 RepID=A0ABR2HP72_9PEZI